MAKILLLNGPNLNLLGQREPSKYGSETLFQIVQSSTKHAQRLGHELVSFQSNHEGALIDRIQKTHTKDEAFIIFNPAAYTHTSIGLRDALLAVQAPFIEVHLSNLHARESFRQTSYFSDIAVGVISGFGALGYSLAIDAANKHLSI